VVSEEAQHSVLEMTMDSEWAVLPPVAPAIEATCEVFTLEEDTEPADLMKIIDKCLKDVRRDKSIQAIKSLSLLTAVTQYVKLRAQYKARGKVSKQPCLKASLTIASQMGKGPYFARKI
jgi:hypothetical protein